MTSYNNVEIRISNVVSSFKKSTRTREKSAFVVEALRVVASLAEGQFGFISHKAWLASLSPEVRANLKPASNNNGPRYTLKAHGVLAVAGNLQGEELEAQSEAEGIELTEDDTIYCLSKAPVTQ